MVVSCGSCRKPWKSRPKPLVPHVIELCSISRKLIGCPMLRPWSNSGCPASGKCQNPSTEVSGPCTKVAWWWTMQGVCTVYSTTWEEETRKATNPVSHLYIQLLLGDTDNMIGPDKLSELAQDRCGWKKIVVAYSAANRWWWWWSG